MKVAVALVIALIIPIFHCGACQRASDREVPRGSLRSKILWGEGLRLQARFEANRRVSGGSWAEME